MSTQAAAFVAGSVRCKMRVTEKKDVAHWDAKKPGKSMTVVKLTAASGEGNRTWSEYTPSGTIELSITNQAAIDDFQLGSSFYVDFTPAPAVEDEAPKAS